MSPGVTRGSSRSTVICEHPKRRTAFACICLARRIVNIECKRIVANSVVQSRPGSWTDTVEDVVRHL